jgi:uncharacterized protein YbjT (DUF2867 family)
MSKVTLLVVGATGNTGRAVVNTLSSHVQSGQRILALTRSASSSTAQGFAKLPGVEVAEKNWVDIKADWLEGNNVKRAFIAPHNEPQHFAEESTFHLECLLAGVEYVVRVSTTAANVTPTCKAYYPRTHWAIEQLLSSVEFKPLGWTSLQPNVFTQLYLGAAAGIVKSYRETGKQGPLQLMADENTPVGTIEPDEIGIFAAMLLSQADASRHYDKRYVLNGPTDITGKQIVAMVEKEIGTKVEDVRYKDMSFVDYMAEGQDTHNKSVIRSIKHAPDTAWAGKCSASTTSKEVLELAAPKRSQEQIWKEMVSA